jgi:hypothetical protein
VSVVNCDSSDREFGGFQYGYLADLH